MADPNLVASMQSASTISEMAAPMSVTLEEDEKHPQHQQQFLGSVITVSLRSGPSDMAHMRSEVSAPLDEPTAKRAASFTVLRETEDIRK
jgi:hypothetical protein